MITNTTNTTTTNTVNNTATLVEMVQMSFYASDTVTLFLKQWSIDGNKTLFIVAIISLCVLCILYEGLKVARQYLLTNRTNNTLRGDGTSDAHLMEIPPPMWSMRDCRLGAHVLQTFLHVVKVCMGYALMLAVMSFNVWLCVAVVGGMGLGYWLFGWATLPVFWKKILLRFIFFPLKRNMGNTVALTLHHQNKFCLEHFNVFKIP